jgi:hypothetical protein
MQEAKKTEVSMLFNLSTFEVTPASDDYLALLVESIFRAGLHTKAGESLKSGFLGVAGVLVVPPSEFDSDTLRVQVKNRLKSVLTHIGDRDYDTVTGETQFGPFKFGLTLGDSISIVEKRLRRDLKRLHRIVEESRLTKDQQRTTKTQQQAAIENTGANVEKLFSELPSDFDGAFRALTAIDSAVRSAIATHFEEVLNRELYERLVTTQPDTYDAKKELAVWLRSVLEPLGLALAHPDTSKPCNLITLPGHDGNGVFLLESRQGRKRSHTTTDLHSLMEFRLTRAVIDRGAEQERTGRSR